jgi:hypothetical protein
MARDAYAVVSEFCESPEAQLRRNAATALAALGSTSSVERLLEMAGKDGDAAVRAHALKELKKIIDTPDGATTVTSVVRRLLANPERRSSAYAIAAQLRHEGIAGLFDALPFRARLRLAWDLPKEIPDLLSWPTRGRFIGSGVIAIAAAGFFLIAFIGLLAAGPRIDISDTVLLMLLSSLLMLGWTLGATVRTVPTLNQVCWGAALVIQVGLAVLLGLGLSVVLLIAANQVENRFRVAFTILAAIVALRLATLTRIGPRSDWRAFQVVIRALTGTFAAVVVFTALTVLFKSSTSREIWAFFALVAAGVATVYARIETHGMAEMRLPRPRAMHSLVSWAVLLGGFAALALASWKSWGDAPINRFVAANSVVSKPFKYSLSPDSEYVFDLGVLESGSVRANVLAGSGWTLLLKYGNEDVDSGRYVSHFFGPESGRFLVEAHPNGNAELEPPTFFEFVQYRLGMGPLRGKSGGSLQIEYQPSYHPEPRPPLVPQARPAPGATPPAKTAGSP